MVGEGNQQAQGSRPLRQASERCSLALPVRRIDGPSGSWRSFDLSEGGCFVSSGPILPPDSLLDVALSLEHEGRIKDVFTRVRVAWTNPQERRRAGRLPPGMGFQFLDLDPSAADLLKQRLEEVKKAQVFVTDVPFEESEISDRVFSRGAEVGAYRVLSLLGAGGMGNVYLAEHRVLGRKVALKTLHSHLSRDADIVQRFFNEGRTVNRINHENIVAVTDFVSENGLNYFVMDYFEGETLGALAKKGLLAMPRVLDIAQQLASALGAAHAAGIMHRDLKPDNVMLVTRNERPDSVRLLDFGIAKLTDTGGVSTTQTATGLLLGTPGYIAPEQILGGEVDHRADIYSFGVLLYQMATGKKPFTGATWPELLMKHTSEAPPVPLREGAQLPRPLSELILRCMAKAPQDRPQSMQEIRDILLTPMQPSTALPRMPEMGTEVTLDDGPATTLDLHLEIVERAPPLRRAGAERSRRVAPLPRSRSRVASLLWLIALIAAAAIVALRFEQVIAWSSSLLSGDAPPRAEAPAAKKETDVDSMAEAKPDTPQDEAQPRAKKKRRFK